MKEKQKKDAIRDLIVACSEKLPNTKYDKFFCEEFAKRIKHTKMIQEISNTLKSFN